MLSVLCYSLSFLTVLDNPDNVDPLLQQILVLCHFFIIGSPFTFVWCPVHIDIEGNEEADAAVRHAADNLHVDAIAIRLDDAQVACHNHDY